LTREIEAYKREFLSEDYIWAKSALLTDYYRWSCLLAKVKPELLLHPSPALVEGLLVRDKQGHLIEHFCETNDCQDRYCLLFGEIDGYPVGGVPDVFAVDKDGVARVADYKKMNTPMSEDALAEDEQLALYVALLRQNGYIFPGQKVYIGHIYLTNDIAEPDGIKTVWVLPSPNALPRLAKQIAYMDRHIQQNDFIPIRGIATGLQAPCLSCGLANVCPMSLPSALVPVLPEEEEEYL
jgi:hypothetical protein